MAPTAPSRAPEGTACRGGSADGQATEQDPGFTGPDEKFVG
jgi:hypothetical protein